MRTTTTETCYCGDEIPVGSEHGCEHREDYRGDTTPPVLESVIYDRTRYATKDAFMCLTITGRVGAGGEERDPVDALSDAEDVLAAVREWAAARGVQ